MNLIMTNKQRIEYTYYHRKAVQLLYHDIRDKLTKDEQEVLLHRVLFHDRDKLLLYQFWNHKDVNKWHNIHAKHHTWKNDENPSRIDILESVLDWESCPMTKSDKRLNAYDAYHKYHPEHADKIDPILHEFGWDHSYKIKNILKKLKQPKDIYYENLSYDIRSFLVCELKTTNGLLTFHDDGLYTIDDHFICSTVMYATIMNDSYECWGK